MSSHEMQAQVGLNPEMSAEQSSLPDCCIGNEDYAFDMEERSDAGGHAVVQFVRVMYDYCGKQTSSTTCRVVIW